MPQLFGNDRVMLYNVDPWSRMGFGVANFGTPSATTPNVINTVGTLNQALWGLADDIGKTQLLIMTHVDAQRTQPPSVNTVMRIAKMLNRVGKVLTGRAVPYNQLRLEPGHQTPSLKVWQIHPVPYFEGTFVRNRFLMEYNDLVMTALTNFYQHSDNRLALEVTQQFAGDIYPYFFRIVRLVGYELLGIPIATLTDPSGFQFDFSMTNGVPSATNSFVGYTPDQQTVNFEMLDTPGDMTTIPTAPDLSQLFNGIPADEIYPNLAQYPVVPALAGADIAGADTLSTTESAAGTGGIGGAGATAIAPGVDAAGAGGATSATGTAAAAAASTMAGSIQQSQV